MSRTQIGNVQNCCSAVELWGQISGRCILESVEVVETASSAWKAVALPLSYTDVSGNALERMNLCHRGEAGWEGRRIGIRPSAGRPDERLLAALPVVLIHGIEPRCPVYETGALPLS